MMFLSPPDGASVFFNAVAPTPHGGLAPQPLAPQPLAGALEIGRILKGRLAVALAKND